MVEINLPAVGESPWAPKLNGSITAINEDLEAFRAEADGRYQSPRSATAVLFGTSLEGQGDSGADVPNPANGVSPVNGRGWMNWFKAYVGQKINLVRNSGVSGNTSTQMVARHVTDVLAHDPGWVFIGGPVNDAPSSIAAATTISNLSTLYEAFEGRRVVQLNLAPRSDYNTTQMRKDVSDVNEWLRNVHTIHPHVIVIDVWRILANPVNGQPAAGLTMDGTHWLEYAALLVGREVARLIGPLLPASLKASLGLLDPRNAFGGVGFNTNGAGWTVVAPANATTTYEADDDTFGLRAKIVVAGASDMVERAVRYVENIASGRFAAGDTVQLSVRIRWSGLTPYTAAAYASHPHALLRFRKADDTYPVQTYGIFIPSNAFSVITTMPAAGDVVMKTAPMTIPAGVDRIYIDLGWLGITNGTILVSEPVLSRV